MRNVNLALFNFLYNELGAIYEKNPIGVESNLNNTEEQNLKYLGTYFPRSYVEAYNIYSNIFKCKEIFNKFNNKKIIRVLDIGSGTGGSLLGLIHVLMENLKNKEIEIISIEGNKNAIDLQSQIFKNLNKVMNFNGNKINGKIYNIKFQDKSELEKELAILSMNNHIDFMQSFKMINEFYREDYYVNKGMFADLLYLADKWLKNSGILCLLDVTYKISNIEFVSILFNEEVKEFLNNKNTKLNYILPKCCAMNYNVCTKDNQCFSKRTFSIQFNNFRDESKVNYKLFIKGKLGEQIRNKILNEGCRYNPELFSCYCKDFFDTHNCTKKEEQPYLL